MSGNLFLCQSNLFQDKKKFSCKILDGLTSFMIKESVNVVLVSLVCREVSSCESEAENRCMSIYRKKTPGNSLPEKIVPDDKGLKKILPSYI